METAWWCALGQDCRGSRPRCVLLVDGTRDDGTSDKDAVAARLTDLIGVRDVMVSPSDHWMPYGKPIRTGKEWNKKPAAEARIDRDACFVPREIQQQLLKWWLVVRSPSANTPNWDVASTCTIEGKKGLLLIEAKAHSKELSREGKSEPCTKNGWKNHKRIGSAIEQANAGLRCVTGGSWGLSRDDRYQLANRFAWCWKLASLDIPVVLLYLGFLNAEDMAQNGTPFRSEEDWACALKKHAQGVVDDSCWGTRLKVGDTPLRPLIRTIDLPFTPDL